MQRLLPEVPHFKTHPIFAKESEVADSKLEEDRSHQLEQSHVAPVSQQPLISPAVESRVDYSTTNSQLSRDSDHEMLKEERSLTAISNKASSVLEFEDPTTYTADEIHKPVLIPLTMDSAMNNFPVRVSEACMIVHVILRTIQIFMHTLYRSPSAKVPCGLTI